MPQVNKIKIRRGLNANIPSPNTEVGELRYSTDSKELYIDDGSSNVKIGGDPAGFPVSTAQQTALNAKANASDTVNLTGDQTVAGVKTFSSSPVVPTATTTTQAVNKSQMDTADALKLNISDPRVELRGVGFPQGVVTAPPGTYYTDTAGTSGAWRWLKKSGTGNTGWECIVGDTGWRDLAATHLAEGWQLATTGRLCVRRANAQVSVAVRVSVASDAAFIGTGRTARKELLKSLPVGFRQSWSVSFATSARVNLTTVGLLTNGGVTGGLDATGQAGNWTAGDEFVAEPTWVTKDAWPTTLPGTPA